MAGLVALVVVVLLIAWAVVAYNGLLAARNQAQRAWSRIDAQLGHRHHLAAAAVQTFGNHAPEAHEQLAAVAQARTDAINADGIAPRADAERRLSRALARLGTVASSHPSLEADEDSTRLRQELASTDDRIAAAHESYDEAVARYEGRRRRIPTSVFAGARGFEELPRLGTDPLGGSPAEEKQQQ